MTLQAVDRVRGCSPAGGGLRWPAVLRAACLRRLVAGLFVLFLFTPASARGQAWLQWDASARAAGRAGAGAALADDPSAAFYGPAGITHLAGTHLRADATATASESRFRAYGVADFDRDPEPALDLALFATHRIAEGVTGGISLTAPWGFAIEWDEPRTFVGRFRATESQLRSVHVNPVLAFGPFGDWSAAIGVDALYGRFDLDRFEQDPALSALGGAGPIDLARTRIDTDGTGIGWNAAVHVRPSERLELGAQVRSEIEVDFTGLARFMAVAPPELRAVRLPGAEETVGERIADLYVDQPARTALIFPRLVIVGASVQPVEQLRLMADVQWAGWDAIQTLTIAFADSSLDATDPLPFDSQWGVRLGAEVELRPAHVLRLGFGWQPSPAAFSGVTPVLPDAGRETYAAGFGFPWAGLAIDLGYRLTILEDREGVAFPGNAVSPDGLYESVEHRLAVGVARRL